jgi:hypothetical protein
LEAIVIARALLRDRRWIVSAPLEIIPKKSKRGDCMLYRRIGQPGSEYLSGFLITLQLYVEYCFD